MTLKEREWFIMTFRMTAKPENELRLLYYENKRVLHICYIEKRGSICNKKRKNFQKCRPNPFFFVTYLLVTSLYHVRMEK